MIFLFLYFNVLKDKTPFALNSPVINKTFWSHPLNTINQDNININKKCTTN